MINPKYRELTPSLIKISIISHTTHNFYITILTVIAEKRLYPSYVKARQGSTVTFSCQTSDPATWRFEKESLMSTKEIKVKNIKKASFLIIKDIKQVHEGEYTCIGYEWGTQFTEIAVLEVASTK